MNERNPFGGKNPNGLYVPLTPDEMEVLERIREGHGIRIEITDWGYIEDPEMIFGDKRVSFQFLMVFKAPDVPMPVSSMEMTVWTKTGHHLFGPKKYPTLIDGQPLSVYAGLAVPLALDIALHEINSNLVKVIKPGAFGLTTYHGNMKLDEAKKKLLHEMYAGEAKVRRQSEEAVKKL